MNTPVAAGRTVNVLGLATVNWLEESWQKHRSFRADATAADAPKVNTAYLTFVSAEPEAVKVRPIAE